MKNTIIISFPFHDWDNLFINDADLIISPTCLSSQEVIDRKLGRYCWDENRIEYLKKLIGDVFLLDVESGKLIENNEFIKQGLCFYGKPCVEEINKVINRLSIKKLKEKKMGISLSLENPVEEILIEKKIKNSYINSMVKIGYSFLYIHQYINKGGRTIIFFINDSDDFFSEIEMVKVASYSNLPDW